MHPHETKQEGDAMSSFNMGYPEIEHTSHGYEDANSHVSAILQFQQSLTRICGLLPFHFPTSIRQLAQNRAANTLRRHHKHEFL
jgi:hypothetical protein